MTAAIYTMEGMGGNGRKHVGLTTYGTSKYAVYYFSEGLALEAKGTVVIVSSLRPGIVVTDLLTERYKDRPEEWEHAKKIYNIIADRVENATLWLEKKDAGQSKEWRSVDILFYMETAVEIGEPAFRQAGFVPLINHQPAPFVATYKINGGLRPRSGSDPPSPRPVG